MDAQNLANAQQPGQPNPENIPNEVRIQTAMANYGQVPTDVQMQTAMSNDAALGLPPWYANMRWKEFIQTLKWDINNFMQMTRTQELTQNMFSTRGETECMSS
ncbi:hypothetical protein TVAGG3_0152050, partial [Trichomonas vaginalis G3]